MIHISKDKYDKSYPYRLYDAWGGVCYCDEEDLKKLKENLEKPLDKSIQICYNKDTVKGTAQRSQEKK